MFQLIALVLSLSAFSWDVAARDTMPGDPSEDHVHSSDKGSHGGSLQHLAGYEAELVVRRRTVVLYLTDLATGTPAHTQGMKAAIFIVQGSNRKGTIILNSKENTFRANAEIPRGADAVVNLQLPTGQSSQARFEIWEHRH